MEFVTQIDGEILLWIQEYLRIDFLDPVMTAVTGLGDAGWFWIAASVFLLFSKHCLGKFLGPCLSLPPGHYF